MIPDDLDAVFREIDNELKAEGLQPYQRPIHAIKKFGQRFKISLPMTSRTKPIPEGHGIPADVIANQKYSNALHAWFEAEYGERLKMDPSDWRCVACLADGDLWEVGLPIVVGSAAIFSDRKLQPVREHMVSTGSIHQNACNALRGITQNRLNRFSNVDLHEVWAMFIVGMDATSAIQRFWKANNFFEQCPADLKVSFGGLIAQHTNYGQSRYASMMLVEHFLKGLLMMAKGEKPPRGHDIRILHEELKTWVPNLDFTNLFEDLHCTAAARYGEVKTTREEAYAAHKAALVAVSYMGQIKP
ncbi:HEPN domain-containing protein [Sinirhodobacter sp. HNIBRBA609]|nr:HEPN domain-containing protein [Sinirhodobacter sp. HNIBRBA609]